MTDTTKDTTKSYPGQAADRLDWLTFQLLSQLTGNEVKALIPMVRDSDQKGYFYSSYTRLQRMAGQSRTAWFKARKGLIDKGIIRQVAKNNHVLTGVDNGWEIDETAWKSPENRDANTLANTDVVTLVDSPENRDGKIPETGTQPVPETGTGNLDRTQVEPSACASGAVALVQPREPNGENQPSESTDRPPQRLTPGGSVDPQVKAEARAAAALAEWEAIPPCADCGRERWTAAIESWTEELERHRLYLKRGGLIDAVVCVGGCEPATQHAIAGADAT